MILKEQPFRSFSEIDADADGMISYEETIIFIYKNIENTSGQLDDSKYFNETLRKYQETDSNNDGYIQLGEFDRELS